MEDAGNARLHREDAREPPLAVLLRFTLEQRFALAGLALHSHTPIPRGSKYFMRMAFGGLP